MILFWLIYFRGSRRPKLRNQRWEIPRVLNLHYLRYLRIQAVAAIELHQGSFGWCLILQMLGGGWQYWGDSSLIITDIYIFLRRLGLARRKQLFFRHCLNDPFTFVATVFLFVAWNHNLILYWMFTRD